MKWLGALVVVSHLAACEKAPDPYPINPGGSGGTGTATMPDAPVFNDASSTITGRVCLLLTTPQSLTGCAASTAGGITVTLGTESTTTADDGSFTLMRPASTTDLYWYVSASDLKTSVIKYGSTTTLPSITTNDYDEMVTALNATVSTGQGALMTRITRMGSAVSGATVAALPAGDSIPYYDEPGVPGWQTQQTGSYGVAWLPSLPTGSVQLTVTSNAMQKSFAGNLVVANAITFVVAEIP
jgi:hypothetical protein